MPRKTAKNTPRDEYKRFFGHLTGRSGHTYWMCFMKIKNNFDNNHK